MAFVKRVLVGRPLATTEMEHQRIPKTIALAVFSSDAISSTAYATEEILFVVAVGGSSLALGLNTLIPIGVAVAILLTIVVTSYRQTIFAYPSGGGSYVVSRENLGENPSLIAGASLLVDYILTVAVSISAGVAAIVSIPAFQDLQKHRVALGLILIVGISLANLRGIKESGRIFAVPTYIYIAILGALVSYGLFRSFVLDDIHQINPIAFKEAGNNLVGGTLGIFILLKGFSSGAVALTGVEAISNGVPAFRRPESKNAAATLVWMGIILGTLFMGVQILAHHLGPYPTEKTTVMSQLGAAVFGSGTVLYVVLQFATAAILTLAANTAYADFPRLSSIIAHDGYLPRQLANRGDRLVFSNGVLVLATAAGALDHRVRRHDQRPDPAVRRGRVPVVHAVAGGHGASPSEGTGERVQAQHRDQRRRLGRDGHRVADRRDDEVHQWRVGAARRHPDHRGRVQGDQTPLPHGGRRPAGHARLQAAPHEPHRRRARRRRAPGCARRRWPTPGRCRRTTWSRCRWCPTRRSRSASSKQWEEFRIDVPLEIVYSPYRELTRPILRYIDELDARWENDVITVLLPEFVVRHWWGNLLHNQTALLLKGRLLFRKGTVVTSLPYHLE